MSDGIREHHVMVSRTARYVTFGSPHATAREIWFAFHGYGQLAGSFATALEALDDGRRLVVVPEGLSRFYLTGTGGGIGASWMTSEDRLHEIEDYIGYLDAILQTVERETTAGTRPTIHLLGFSQGSATACRWIAHGAVRPKRLIIWGGEIPADLDWTVTGNAFRSLDEVVLVAGTDDRYATSQALERHADVLRSHGVRHRTVAFEGGHRLDDDALRSLVTSQGSRGQGTGS